MLETAIFAFLSALVVIPAILVVTVKSVFHSALWLIASLLGVAGVYAMLAADFVFAVQLLVYVGGIMVVLLFVILLSGKPSDWAGKQVNEKAWAAAIFSAFFVAALSSFLVNWAYSPVVVAPQVTTGRLGSLFLNEMLLPFEIISLILVAALVGAIYFSAKRPS